MSGPLVREVSDGEELVIERMPPKRLLDPRERTIEARRRALGDHKTLPERTQS